MSRVFPPGIDSHISRRCDHSWHVAQSLLKFPRAIFGALVGLRATRRMVLILVDLCTKCDFLKDLRYYTSATAGTQSNAAGRDRIIQSIWRFQPELAWDRTKSLRLLEQAAWVRSIASATHV